MPSPEPSSLAAGTRLAHYEIVALLGAGGMGEVYRARDTKLQRDVALKVLPPDTATDPERRQRFEREARAVAALNHPSIVTIHSVDEVDGRLFLTMELVDGQPLSELIRPGGLPLAQLLAIATPLADAVSAAHARGITHRDLKPANVMVTPTRQVKVLDFGLAKLLDTGVVTDTMATGAPDVITGQGKILGTIAYMAPEQAEGKPVDARSDIFSLGVMLYEMATGERPFKGDTSVSTLAAIMRDTPKSVTEVNPAIPKELGRVIRRALSKDPDRRQQTGKDLRNELDDLRKELESGELTASMSQTAAVRAAAPAPRRMPVGGGGRRPRAGGGRGRWRHVVEARTCERDARHERRTGQRHRDVAHLRGRRGDVSQPVAGREVDRLHARRTGHGADRHPAASRGRADGDQPDERLDRG